MKINLTLLIVIIFSSTLVADCLFAPGFITQAKESDLVALVVVKQKVEHGYLCGIIDKITSTNKEDSGGIVLVWGASWCNTERCSIVASPGDTLLIAVNMLTKDETCDSPGFTAVEKRGTYSTTACGNNVLEYHNGMITGAITKSYGHIKDEKTNAEIFRPYYQENIEFNKVKNLLLN